MTVHTSYLKTVYNRETYKEYLQKSFDLLKTVKEETPFDAIAFTGTSGAAFAYPLSHMLDVSLICVRKSTDNSHYSQMVEGYGASKNFIIVDDFFSGGSTLKRILDEVKKFYIQCAEKTKT